VDRFDNMRVFAKVVESGSFAGAAARLGISASLFTPATTDGGFTDPNIPAGFAPFGTQNIDGELFVTYAKQNAQKHDDVPGPGNGFVDVFDTDGHLLRRFASRGPLNSPWGVARASFAFGRLVATSSLAIRQRRDQRVRFRREIP
jgi:uncharacterized protein (TIGR03118 family)